MDFVPHPRRPSLSMLSGFQILAMCSTPAPSQNLIKPLSHLSQNLIVFPSERHGLGTCLHVCGATDPHAQPCRRVRLAKDAEHQHAGPVGPPRVIRPLIEGPAHSAFSLRGNPYPDRDASVKRAEILTKARERRGLHGELPRPASGSRTATRPPRLALRTAVTNESRLNNAEFERVSLKVLGQGTNFAISLGLGPTRRRGSA
jgi:hypothetical protein